MPSILSSPRTGGGFTSLTRPAPPPARDEDLLAQYRGGDRSALDELFRRHRLLAYRVAYRLLGNEADALDAVQEGFVKVLVHLDSFEGRSTFKTWLLRVISNAALDLGRQRGRQDFLSIDAPEAEEREGLQPLAETNPAVGLERADLRGLLEQALATLPEAQRRTFVLHADAELSYREVAEVMNISIGTVMSRLYYARQKLRTFLTRRMAVGP
ncbi:MAG: RNA polymerase sigma factor [Planctomycetia bacterium]|nr:RNA polymerase sigma factor [Planctomycetia bacterium]